MLMLNSHFKITIKIVYEKFRLKVIKTNEVFDLYVIFSVEMTETIEKLLSKFFLKKSKLKFI